jgi:hypothetical protein
MSRNLKYDNLIESIRDDFFETNFTKFGVSEDKCAFYKNECVANLYKMKSVYEAKDSDYSENDLPMGNLLESEELGIRPWKGVLLRIGDKKRRIGSFLNKKSYRVKDEALQDTLTDMANYSLLGNCLFLQNYDFVEFHKEQQAWVRMGFNCVIAKVLFENDSNKDAWTDIMWPNILNCYQILADFAKTH